MLLLQSLCCHYCARYSVKQKAVKTIHTHTAQHNSMQTMQHYATLPNSSITTQLFLLGSLFSDVGATQVPKSYIVLCFRCVNQIHLDTTGFNCLHQRKGRGSELLKPVRFIQIWHEITGWVKIVWSKVGPLFSSTNVKIVVTRPNWARKPY